MRDQLPVRRLLSLAVVFGLASAPLAQTLTPLEFKCQLKSTTAEAKFTTAKLKCVSRCYYEYWHSGVMATYTDCLPPYGGETATCIDDTVLGLKGAENKFSAAILKACVYPSTADCPECYSGGDCTAEAASRVGDVESQVDSFIPGIFCEVQDAMPQEQWCQRGVAKVFAKFVTAQHKCYAKCEYNASKGLFPASDCLPPTSNTTAQTCLATAEAKSVASIDKICNDVEVPHSEPECLGPYPDGAAWTNLFSIAVAGNIPSRYCGSASGAFID
jgi:hypothetical protein